MKSFIDAERLGTLFSQKLIIRRKILTILIEILLKSSSQNVLFTKKIIEFSNENEGESLKIINILLTDTTYLIDEVIMKLEQIKMYQDLVQNLERFESMDEETRIYELERFAHNDSLAKNEITVKFI